MRRRRSPELHELAPLVAAPDSDSDFNALEPGREDVLAEVLIRFAGNRNQLQGLGEAARRCYRQHFTPGRWVDTYWDLYQRCLNHFGLNGLSQQDRSPSAATVDYHHGSV